MARQGGGAGLCISREFLCHVIKQGKKSQSDFAQWFWRSAEDLRDFALGSLGAISNDHTWSH